MILLNLFRDKDLDKNIKAPQELKVMLNDINAIISWHIAEQ